MEPSNLDERYVPMDSVEPLAMKAGGDQKMKGAETKIVPGDLASRKPNLFSGRRQCQVSESSRREIVDIRWYRSRRIIEEIAEVSSDGSTDEVHKVTQEQVLSLDKDAFSSNGDGVLASALSSAGNDVLPGGPCQLTVSEDLFKENNAAEAQKTVEEKSEKSYENSVFDDIYLQSYVSEVSSQEGDTAEMRLTRK